MEWELRLVRSSLIRPVILAAMLTLMAAVAGVSVASAQQPQRGAPPVARQEIRNPFTDFFNLFQQRQPEVKPAPSDRSTLRRPAAPVQQSGLRRRTPLAVPPPMVVTDAPAAPRAETTVFVTVIGDTLAELLSSGLSDTFADNPAVQITRRTRASTGLVRDDFFDWRKSVAEILGSPDKITHAVVMMGSNDRQPMRDAAGATLEPFSPAWRAAYTARVDEIVKAFVDRNIILLWVGMPIMQNARLSADMMAINAIVRARVSQAGGIYVDIYEAFADDEGQYVASGPSVTGETERMRTSDGVHFTRSGARKAAHFVEVEFSRLLKQGQPATIVALPASDPASLDPALQPGGVERMIDEAVRIGRGDPEDIPPIPSKPIAGPIVALTQTELAAGGHLLGAQDSPASGLIDGVLVQRRPSEPKTGRADDFRWPVN